MSDSSSVCSEADSELFDEREVLYGETCIVDATRSLFFEDSFQYLVLSADINDSDNRVADTLSWIPREDVKRLVRAFRGHIDLNVVGEEGRSAIWLRDLVDQFCTHREFTVDGAIDFIERFVYANLCFTQTTAFVHTNGNTWEFERLYGDHRPLAISSVAQVEKTLATQVTSFDKTFKTPLFLFHYAGALYAAHKEDVTDDHIRVLDYLSVQRQTELSMAPPNKILVALIDDLVESILCMNPTYIYVCPQLPPLSTVHVDPRISCLMVAPIYFFADKR